MYLKQKFFFQEMYSSAYLKCKINNWMIKFEIFYQNKKYKNSYIRDGVIIPHTHGMKFKALSNWYYFTPVIQNTQ